MIFMNDPYKEVTLDYPNIIRVLECDFFIRIIYKNRGNYRIENYDLMC